MSFFTKGDGREKLLKRNVIYMTRRVKYIAKMKQ